MSTRAEAPSFSVEALAAVTVPSFWNTGFNEGIFVKLHVFVFLVFRNHDGIAFALGHFHGYDFVVEFTFSPSLLRTGIAFDGVFVLLFAADATFLGTQFGCVAHVVVVMYVGGAVLHQAVDHRSVAEAVAVAGRVRSSKALGSCFSIPPATTVS